MPLQQQSCHYNDWHIVAVKLHVDIAHEQIVTYSLSFCIALRLSTAHEQIVSHFADECDEYKGRHQSLASGNSDYC
eukprot:19112-Heterococcus_DN1.PRE.6